MTHFFIGKENTKGCSKLIESKGRFDGFTLLDLMLVIFVIFVLTSIAALNYENLRLFVFNTLTKNNLRQAYNSALSYFSENPGGKINRPTLESHGYSVKDNVRLEILKDTSLDLLMVAFYAHPGSTLYIVDTNGNIRSAITLSNPSAAQIPTPISGNPDGQISSIQSLPNDPSSGNSPSAPLVKYPELAKNSLREAFRVANAFFTEFPEGTITVPILETYGYVPAGEVNLAIIGDRRDQLLLMAYSHLSKDQTFTIDSRGIIQP